jgi:putative endonuclease
MFKVYVLYSPDFNKLYVGFTSSLRNRLISHNLLGVKDWTRSYRPWLLIHVEIFDAKKEALAREKVLKSGKGREFIRKQILPLFL